MAQSSAPGAFTSANAVDSVGSAGAGVFDPSLATDGNGNWKAVWASDDDLGGVVGSDLDILISESSDNGGTWSSPVTVNASAEGDSADDRDPSIATDGSNWIVVWSTDGETRLATIGGAEVSLGSGSNASVAASNGGWVAVAASGGDIAVSDSDGGSATVDSGADDGNPDVGAGGGSYLAAFEAGGDIAVASSSDGWTSVGSIGVGAGPRVAHDGNNWVVVWSSAGSIVMSVSSDGGSTFSNAVAIGGGADDGSSVSVATDGDGSWVAAWSAIQDGEADIVYSASGDNGLSWTDSQTISGAGDDENADIATDGNGKWIAIWESSDTLAGDFNRDVLFATGVTTSVIVTDTGQSLGSATTNDITLADLDGDGDLDQYEAVGGGGADAVWVNDGAGTFSAGPAIAGANNFDSRRAALGDIDGDGDADAVVAVNGANQVYTNGGAADLTNDNQNMGAADSRGVALGDLDGDGALDAVFANGGGANNTTYLNDGTGDFGGAATQTLSTTLDSNGVALADLDGDSDLDAFFANGSGQGNTVFTNNAGTLSNSGQSLGTGNSVAAALGDVDGDGDVDAFVANASPNAVYLNNGAGIFSDSGQSLGNAVSSDVQLVDVDADGDLDAVVSNGGSPNAIWLNDGAGNFAAGPTFGGSGTDTSVAVGDLDGDGQPDIVIGTSGAGNSVLTTTAAAAGAGGGGGNGSNGPCFIATAAYGTPMADDIDALRRARDSYLMNNAAGLFFVDTYYRVSPVVAEQVAQHPWMATVVRAFLVPVLYVVELFMRTPMTFVLLAAFAAALALRGYARKQSA